MDINEFMRALTGLNRYMIVDESIVTIGIGGMSGQAESRRKALKGTT
jgi:hypothetical protein